ncbi:hypothetical protein CMV30_07870 [Nibricoccus aquaticus]|uniref:DUF4402 domain-containing protein n=1 Tax=Nibricoccus aquaticus TaxID=2576891 RepID=A0A290Q9J1_9BACT|nr:hypothetical protein [Nibricoccus aquaticus]ATC63870.1 hypothetical protein CMV30_07870 [Nibricoccus aquaticus]
MSPAPHHRAATTNRAFLLACTCAAWLALAPPSGAVNSIEFVAGASQSQLITAAHLTGGPGADYASRIPLGGLFTLRVNSDQPCRISVQRQNTGVWFVEGQLLVQIVEIGASADERPPVPIDSSAAPLIDSASPLIDQTYGLRYLLDGMSVKNAPRTYTTEILFTVTDLE